MKVSLIVFLLVSKVCGSFTRS